MPFWLTFKIWITEHLYGEFPHRKLLIYSVTINKTFSFFSQKADEVKAKQEMRQASAREKRHLLNEAKRYQSPAKHSPAKQQQMVLRPVGFSSKGESYQVVSSTRERPPSPAQRQRMELLKAQVGGDGTKNASCLTIKAVHRLCTYSLIGSSAWCLKYVYKLRTYM